MSKLLLAAASTLALSFAGQAFAQTAVIGQVGANYARNNLEAGGAEADADAFQGEAAVAFKGAGAIGGRIDGAVTHFDSDDLGGDATVFAATGHVDYLAGPNLFGGFVGVEHNDEATLWALGVEGKASADAGSVYVQLGYGQADDLDDVDFWAVRAEGRLFLNDNTRLGLFGGATRADSDFGDLDMWNLGVDAEHQFASLPVAVFASYERGEMDDLDLTSDTFRIGARYTFGAGLRERDRAGVGQGSVGALFGGALGTGVLAIAGEVLP